MSRYVHIAVALPELGVLAEILKVWGHPVQCSSHGQVMLQGSLECSGEPVDLRLPAGTCGAAEDFGFNQGQGSLELICSDVDRNLLEHRLLRPLLQELARRRLHQAADRLGMTAEETVASDGSRRVILRSSPSETARENDRRDPANDE